MRWTVYHKILATRLTASNEKWNASLVSAQRRVAELLSWPKDHECPRWRLIECWTIAAYGPQMAAAGGFRLAFWNEDKHGPRLERALTRYQRFAKMRPPDWPHSPIAALARFLTEHTPRQDGPEHGMAYDIARFNELAKQMSAYAHYQREDHLELAARRARRRQQLNELAQQLNQQLRFRLPTHRLVTRLQTARQLLDSDYAPHQAAGRKLYTDAKQAEQLAQRDQRLLAGQHPGDSDGRYQAAYRYAQRWGLPLPAGKRNQTAR